MSHSIPQDQNPSQVTNAANLDTLKSSFGAIGHAEDSHTSQGDPHMLNAPPTIYADYVVVFRYNHRLDPKTRGEDITRVKKVYKRVIERLRDVGLKSQTRTGSEGLLLIFVICPWDRLRHAVHASRLADWLHGIGTVRSPDPDHMDEQPLTEAERLRIVHALITSPSHASYGSFLPGAGIVPRHPDFPEVDSIMPMHNAVFNRRWLNKISTKYLLDADDVHEIRDHFGEQFALYFSFLQFYFLALSVPTLLGILAYFLDEPFSMWYGGTSILWSSITVEIWRQREETLAISWGCQGTTQVEQKRAAFRGSIRVDPVSETPTVYYPWWKRELYMIAAVPVMALFAICLAMMITCIFSVEVFITEAYQGPAKQYLGVLPTILFTLSVPNFIKLYQGTALYLTNLENHETESDQDRHLTRKVFILNFFTAYLGLFLTAYIYIPLGKVIVPHLSLLDISGNTKADAIRFAINPSRLHKQLFSLMVINQAINFGTEVLLPFAMRFGYRKVQNIRDQRASRGTARSSKPSADKEQEHEYLERVRREVALPEESLFIEFAEMVTQFGHVSLFGVIWPLAPLAAFVNNWFELRGDAAKVALSTRRPIPVRMDSIGPWLDSMEFLAWLSALTTSSLVYLFRPGLIHPHSPIATTASGESGKLSGSLLQELSASIDPTVCLKTLLVVVLAEHIQSLVGRITSHLIRRFAEDDHAHVSLRKSEWAMKQTLRERHAIHKNKETSISLQQKEEIGDENLGTEYGREQNAFWADANEALEETERLFRSKEQ